MNHDFWQKTTTFNLFGIKIWQKDEVCRETNYTGEMKFIVAPEYYDAEFKDKDA